MPAISEREKLLANFWPSSGCQFLFFYGRWLAKNSASRSRAPPPQLATNLNRNRGTGHQEVPQLAAPDDDDEAVLEDLLSPVDRLGLICILANLQQRTATWPAYICDTGLERGRRPPDLNRLQPAVSSPPYS